MSLMPSVVCVKRTLMVCGPFLGADETERGTQLGTSWYVIGRKFRQVAQYPLLCFPSSRLRVFVREYVRLCVRKVSSSSMCPPLKFLSHC